MERSGNSMMLATDHFEPTASKDALYTFSIDATEPPVIDGTVVQRTDEMTLLLRMIRDQQTSAVIVTGESGMGKTTLAALMYQNLLMARKAGNASPQHLIWLSLSMYTTLPDVIAAILSRVQGQQCDRSFFRLQTKQQLNLLHNALWQESAFIVIDQAELLFVPEAGQEGIRQDHVGLFFEMLQAGLGPSRMLLVSSHIPGEVSQAIGKQIHTFPLSRINLPEGIALLQRRGVQGTYNELSQIWERCDGNAFSLVLFSGLMKLGGLSFRSILHISQNRSIVEQAFGAWLLDAVYARLTPTQYTIMRTLCLFSEAITLQGLTSSVIGAQSQLRLPALEREIALLAELALVQQTVNEQGIACYALPHLFRHYITAHYLIGSGQHTPSTSGSSLGVAMPMQSGFDLDTQDAEMQNVALAAAHRQVITYYEGQRHELKLAGDRQNDLRAIEPVLMMIRHLCLGWQWQKAYELLEREHVHEILVDWGKIETLFALYVELLPPNGLLTPNVEERAAQRLRMLYGQPGNMQQRQDMPTIPTTPPPNEQGLSAPHRVGESVSSNRINSTARETAHNFEYAAMETQRYAAVQTAQIHHNVQVQAGTSNDPLAQSQFETHILAAAPQSQSRTSHTKNKKQPNKPGVKGKTQRQDSELVIGRNGRIGTSNLWSNGTF
jgi:hypothetical protein